VVSPVSGVDNLMDKINVKDKVLVKVIFFASFKERLNCNEQIIEIRANSTITDLCHILVDKGSAWQKIFTDPSSSVKVACNQQMAEFSSIIHDNDEVAFFPPVTGG
jgi:molybdopterin synthase sulfur carrier subunit